MRTAVQILAVGLMLMSSRVVDAQVRPYRPYRPYNPTPTESPYMPSVPGHLPRWKPIGRAVNPRVQVRWPTRLDWTYAALAEPTAAGLAALAMPDYYSARQHYQMFLPNSFNHRVPQPLILYLSPSSEDPREFDVWEEVCEKHGVFFVAAYGAGDGVPFARRVRIALDVLDDVRRRFLINTDRTYVVGSESGAAVACALAYSLPEVFGGVVAINGGAGLRPEPMLRDRVKERLSVALVTTERAASQIELEKLRLPVLRDSGVRARLWVVPARTASPAAVTEELFGWMEAALPARNEQYRKWPVSRFLDSGFATPAAWSTAMLGEAMERVQADATRVSGLMQLYGITVRWKGTPAAAEAEKVLRDFDAQTKGSWEQLYRQQQQVFTYRQARATNAVADAVPERDKVSRALVARQALAEWVQVLKYGADTREGKEAKEQVERWKKELGER